MKLKKLKNGIALTLTPNEVEIFEAGLDSLEDVLYQSASKSYRDVIAFIKKFRELNEAEDETK